ncbi:XdhC family protein [Arthrobacter mobilis]|uniref:XdhC family protein n=1 Tax=Arthrobacter mobilis TaxID=2724944 RepID=A0A7X6HD09_9MICC|nr:XdhC/CoxI family protein [Arthrobacter mobilis]NKX54270.1 XdhC family protein [Arthrobacter mobilis]
MLNLGSSLPGWLEAAGGRCAAATIIGASGSVPRPVGTSMLVAESGEVLGSLSGGCVEGAVVAAALEALEDGRPRREHFGFSREDALAAGLTCGGELDVHIEPLDGEGGGLPPRLLALLAGFGPQEPLALVRRIDPGGSGALLVPGPQRFRAADYLAQLQALAGSATAARSAAAQLSVLLPAGHTGLLRLGGEADCAAGDGGEPPALLVQTRLLPPRMLVFGANDFSEALLPAAKLLGYRVTLCDARPAFARQLRFGTADDVVTDWPHRYLAAEAAAGRIDARTVACVLTHDPKFDLPLLQTALGLDLAYLGAMGSQRSHRRRVQELLAAGVEPAALARLRSPIGLDLQAATPAEVAVSITAEIIAGRNPAATGRPLSACAGPIHAAAGSAPAAADLAPARTGGEPAWT